MMFKIGHFFLLINFISDLGKKIISHNLHNTCEQQQTAKYANYTVYSEVKRNLSPETSKTTKKNVYILCAQKRVLPLIQQLLLSQSCIKGLTEQRKKGMEASISKPPTSHILHSQHPPSFSWRSPLRPFFSGKRIAFLHNFPLFLLLIYRESVYVEGNEIVQPMQQAFPLEINIQHKIDVALVQLLHQSLRCGKLL